MSFIIFFDTLFLFEMVCAIWYHFYNLKNVKNTHGVILLLVKLQAWPAVLLKITFIQGCFSSFLNCANSTKLRNVIHSTFHVTFKRKREITKVMKSLENICKRLIFHFPFCHILIFAGNTQFYKHFR